MKGFTLAESAYVDARSLMDERPGRSAIAHICLSSRTFRASMAQFTAMSKASARVVRATPQLRQAGEQTSSSIFLESLAAVQVDAGDGDSAKQTIDRALALEAKPPVRLRLILAKAGLLKASGNEAEAAELIKSHDGERREPFQSQVLEAISEPT
jgi:hypothetical protein